MLSASVDAAKLFAFILLNKFGSFADCYEGHFDLSPFLDAFVAQDIGLLGQDLYACVAEAFRIWNAHIEEHILAHIDQNAVHFPNASLHEYVAADVDLRFVAIW